MSDRRDGATGRADEEQSRIEALAPGFLIAPPPLSDPNFDRSLVLLTMHGAQGAQGFILNRVAPWRLHALLDDLEVPHTIADRGVLHGGPVSPEMGFVLYEHEPDTPVVEGIAITPTLSFTPSRDALASAARGRLPGRFDLLLGYAGWGPDQLENELRRGAWLHAPFDAELVFSVPVDRRWEEAWTRMGVNPLGFVAVPGGAQA
jgi:putative transcriptional regulator